ncbi:hypothetical protein BDZ89DRAFT_1066722 [Hymenopellis radicata]|nr:hypothetical protein BDZ89DRAFT_1066722 [Hymenopellis radicata]
MQFKLFALVAALATLAAATPLENRAAAGCVFVPISQGCASDWVSCGLNGPGNAVKCCQIVCQ